jgi:hypothetical protein
MPAISDTMGPVVTWMLIDNSRWQPARRLSFLARSYEWGGTIPGPGVLAGNRSVAPD